MFPPAAPSLWERPNHSTTSKVAYFKRKYAEEEDLHGGLHGYFQKVWTSYCSHFLFTIQVDLQAVHEKPWPSQVLYTGFLHIFLCCSFFPLLFLLHVCHAWPSSSAFASHYICVTFYILSFSFQSLHTKESIRILHTFSTSMQMIRLCSWKKFSHFEIQITY